MRLQSGLCADPRCTKQIFGFTALASGETNQLHSFLDKILLKLTYDKWFFGCYHKDTQLSTKSRCVFCDVISMGERHAKRSVR